MQGAKQQMVGLTVLLTPCTRVHSKSRHATCCMLMVISQNEHSSTRFSLAVN